MFGAAYGAGVLYELVPPSAGFVLLAAASLVGVAISLRHGQLVAAVGLVGAFVTPALVQTENPSLPGLFGYLLFVTATALAVVRYTAWIWLGWATTIAGAVWVLLAIAAGTDTDIWAPALFVPAAAALNLGLLPGAALDHPIGRRLAWVPCAALGATGLLLAMLDQGWTARIGVLLFVPLTIWQGARESRLRLLPFLAALLFLLLLAGWSVEIRDWPDIAIPPGAWTPAVVQALLATAALVAGCFAASGLWFERRAAHPLPWASLAASVPVLTLAICYARVAEFEPSAGWAAFAMLLAAGLTGARRGRAAGRAGGKPGASRHPRRGRRRRPGSRLRHAAARPLAESGGFTVPAGAGLGGGTGGPAGAAPGGACRRLGGAGPAAAERLRARLRVRPLAGGERIARGIRGARRRFRPGRGHVPPPGATTSPSGCWRRGAWRSRRCLWPWRSGRAWGRRPACMRRSSASRKRRWMSRPWPCWRSPRCGSPNACGGRCCIGAWRVQGALALAGSVLLILDNPLFTDVEVGNLPLLDWLLPAYLVPALLAVVARRNPATEQPPRAAADARRAMRWSPGLSGSPWRSGTCSIPASIGLDAVGVEDAELWAWSGAWLAYGVAVMAIGIAAGIRRLRLAALAIVGLTTAKVFLVDMSGLVGLWRVLSFLGLGLVLIGLGAAYQRLVAPRPRQ